MSSWQRQLGRCNSGSSKSTAPRRFAVTHNTLHIVAFACYLLIEQCYGDFETSLLDHELLQSTLEASALKLLKFPHHMVSQTRRVAAGLTGHKPPAMRCPVAKTIVAPCLASLRSAHRT